LKTGITKACFYEPNVNRTYEEMAKHYKTAIVPARPRKPKDYVALTDMWHSSTQSTQAPQIDASRGIGGATYFVQIIAPREAEVEGRLCTTSYFKSRRLSNDIGRLLT
jgi:hypothetical protein